MTCGEKWLARVMEDAGEVDAAGPWQG